MKLLIYCRCLEASCSLLRSFMQPMVASCLGMLKAHNRIMDSGRKGQIPSLSPEEVAAGWRLPKVQLIHFPTHCNEVPVGRWVCRKEQMESRNSWFLLCLLSQWHSDVLLQGHVASDLCLNCALCLSSAKESMSTAVVTGGTGHWSAALPPKWEVKLPTLQGNLLLPLWWFTYKISSLCRFGLGRRHRLRLHLVIAVPAELNSCSVQHQSK